MLKASGARDVRGVQRQRFCARSDGAQKRCAQSVATPWLRGSSSEQQPLHLNVFIAEDAVQELCRARAGPCGGPLCGSGGGLCWGAARSQACVLRISSRLCQTDFVVEEGTDGGGGARGRVARAAAARARGTRGALANNPPARSWPLDLECIFAGIFCSLTASISA